MLTTPREENTIQHPLGANVTVKTMFEFPDIREDFVRTDNGSNDIKRPYIRAKTSTLCVLLTNTCGYMLVSDAYTLVSNAYTPVYNTSASLSVRNPVSQAERTRNPKTESERFENLAKSTVGSEGKPCSGRAWFESP